MLGLGLGLGFNNVPSGGFSQAARNWRTWIEGNGGTIPDSLLAIFDANFFIPATANGNILTELDRLLFFAGLLGYEIAARTNMVQNAFYVAPVSSPTFDNNGYRSSGTSYLDLNYNPATQGVKFTQNSASMGFVRARFDMAGRIDTMGHGNGTNGMQIFGASSAQLWANNNGPFINFGSQTAQTTKTFVNIKRTSSTNCVRTFQTTDTSYTSTSAAIVSLNSYELTHNNGGIPSGNFDTQPHLASWHGSGNLDQSALRTLLNNTFTALGV